MCWHIPLPVGVYGSLAGSCKTQCVSCDYDLTGTPDGAVGCSECGLHLPQGGPWRVEWTKELKPLVLLRDGYVRGWRWIVRMLCFPPGRSEVFRIWAAGLIASIWLVVGTFCLGVVRWLAASGMLRLEREGLSWNFFESMTSTALSEKWRSLWSLGRWWLVVAVLTMLWRPRYFAMSRRLVSEYIARALLSMPLALLLELGTFVYALLEHYRVWGMRPKIIEPFLAFVSRHDMLQAGIATPAALVIGLLACLYAWKHVGHRFVLALLIGIAAPLATVAITVAWEHYLPYPSG